MYPAKFQIHRPETLEAALQLLSRWQGEVNCLAGGQSLIPSMRLRLAQPEHILDLSGISDLRGIRALKDSIVIGAMTKHREVESSPIVSSALPGLSRLAGDIADLQVRNRGTIGGSLANADPAADYPAGILACDAAISVVGLEGHREIASDDWPVSAMTTALQESEIIVSVRFPILQKLEGFHYIKVHHPASRFAVVGVAAKVRVMEDGTCVAARIAVTGVGEAVQRARAAEESLIGRTSNDEHLKQASRTLSEEIEVSQDGLLVETAKRHLSALTAQQALTAALREAAEQIGRRGGPRSA
jgi:carbon-monoxide dehydrogenase medium subunit